MIVHDDVLATGGTAKAKIELVEKLGGEVVGLLFVVELTFLNAREKLAGYDVQSLIIELLKGDAGSSAASMSIWTMYDALTARYTFACPRREQAQVALSSFRLLERLPGASHPAVYGVRFDCGCGEEHPGLVSHDDLDWAPLGAHAGAFVDLMTSRTGDAAGELLDVAASHLKAGEWPGASTATRRGGRGPSSRPRSSRSRPESGRSGSRCAAPPAARSR